MRRGFTLIELALVIAIIGLLTTMVVPAYDLLVRRARAAEVRSTLEAIADAELAHRRDTGSYLPCGSPGPGLFELDPKAQCWSDLGIHFGAAPRFRYAVAADRGSFTALAVGDQDHDGKLARFRLEGAGLAFWSQDPFE